MTAARLTVFLIVASFCLDSSAQRIPTNGAEFFAPLDISESVPVSIVDTVRDNEAKGPNDAELARWALRDWKQALDGRLRFHFVEREDDALIRVRFVGPGGGQYGEMQRITVDGRRGAAVFVRPDTRALGPVISQRASNDALYREAIVYLTCLHELGHALGLPHTADYTDIMYAFGFGGDIEEYFMRYRRGLAQRSDIALQSGLSNSDRERINALYSGETQ